MIWYLLYPLRGTTEPPTLEPTHPLRRAVTSYGRDAARHPIFTLLISVTLGAFIVYPFFFLYASELTSGASVLPHHVWTAAVPLEGNEATRVDVVIRSLWIHGREMEAITPRVFELGLEVENQLLGRTANTEVPSTGSIQETGETTSNEWLTVRDGMHISRGVGQQSWFLYSPSMLWTRSSESLYQDMNVMEIVNRSPDVKYQNVSLRHSILFAGKHYERKRLMAADALVTTLVHMTDSPVGRYWEQHASNLGMTNGSRWSFYQNPSSANSAVYELRIKPLSRQDDIMLGVSYSIMLIYFLFSLCQTRAVRSRIGLAVSVVTQLVFSVTSSFTICALLSIDLSMIPRETFPLVILAVGLENMFRLMNAVVATPNEMATASRIGEAVGLTGPIALMSVLQNLVVLFLSYQAVSPGLGAFCIFTGIALIFDLLYLMTFFLAVLSVDVRRTELSDSLDRARQDVGKDGQPRSNITWTQTVLQGQFPLSTRISGTVVIIGFLFISQLHFFDYHRYSAYDIWHKLVLPAKSWRNLSSLVSSQKASDVHHRVSSSTWIRLQDHFTTQEIMRIAKPGAFKCTARIYDPLVVVLKGVDRLPVVQRPRVFLPAVYSFVQQELLRFLLSLSIVVLALTVLMNFLLWNDEVEVYGGSPTLDDDDQIPTTHLVKQRHALDLVMLATSPCGIIVTVGLDRRIWIWNLRSGVSTMVDVPRIHVLFPLLAISLDENGKRCAFLSKSGRLSIWSTSDQAWCGQHQVVDIERAPISFMISNSAPHTTFSVLIICRTGDVVAVDFIAQAEPVVRSIRLPTTPIVCVLPFVDLVGISSPTTSVLTVGTASGVVFVITGEVGRAWRVTSAFPDIKLGHIHSMYTITTLNVMFLVQDAFVEMLEVTSSDPLHHFHIQDAEPSTIRLHHSMTRRHSSLPSSLASLTIGYTDRKTGNCVLRVFSPAEEEMHICLGDTGCPYDLGHCLWEECVEETYQMVEPGTWHLLTCGTVVGVRRQSSIAVSTKIGGAATTLRRRVQSPPQHRVEDEDVWEAWTMSRTGKQAVLPLQVGYERSADGLQLLSATSCGPLSEIGQRSIAIGLGNMLYIVTVGDERYDGNELSCEASTQVASRRRKASKR